jgi:threonine dehydrogenase-like Zn-dependent dehydrogenase
MKAIAKTRPKLGVEIIDAPMPRPGPDQILVRVAACGICGSDLHIYLWELGADRALSRMPAVIGHEPAGEVVELGAGVTAFKVGDHVALDPFGPCGKCSLCQSGRFNFCKNPGRLGGAFAEYCIAPVENAWRVPQSMDLEEAALLEPFATGLHAVEISDLKAGGGCVIEGPGPIGLSTALSARAMGCTSIVVTGLAQDAERLALVRDMGFKTVCASDRDWTDQVRVLMPPDGADVVFDAAAPGFCPQTSASRRRAGRARMAGARYPERRDARALFPRRPDSAVTRASRRYMAPCDLIGVERRRQTQADGDASL